MSTGGYVGATSQSARDIMYLAFRVGTIENNHQRAAGSALPRAAFDAQATPGGGMLVGSLHEVIDKAMAFHLAYGLDRVILQMGLGAVPHADHLAATERLEPGAVHDTVGSHWSQARGVRQPMRLLRR